MHLYRNSELAFLDSEGCAKLSLGLDYIEMGNIHLQSCDQIITRMKAKLFQGRVYIPVQSVF